MKRPKTQTDQTMRSFLQKAVRRGDRPNAERAIQYLFSLGDLQWLRNRLAVMVFEECWPYGMSANFQNREEIIVDQYLQLLSLKKHKDAAGLGSLAYALSKGDKTVLCGRASDSHINILCQAIRRPADFWLWTHKQIKTPEAAALVKCAESGYRKAGWPWDRAFVQAAAYLAISSNLPAPTAAASESNRSVPAWVAIDKHTTVGNDAIRLAAKDTGVHPEIALWVSFYLESATCNSMSESNWWEWERDWRLRKLGLDSFKAKNIWATLRPLIQSYVSEEAAVLTEKIMSVNIPPTENFSVQRELFG